MIWILVNVCGSMKWLCQLVPDNHVGTLKTDNVEVVIWIIIAVIS